MTEADWLSLAQIFALESVTQFATFLVNLDVFLGVQCASSNRNRGMDGYVFIRPCLYAKDFRNVALSKMDWFAALFRRGLDGIP